MPGPYGLAHSARGRKTENANGGSPEGAGNGRPEGLPDGGRDHDVPDGLERRAGLQSAFPQPYRTGTAPKASESAPEPALRRIGPASLLIHFRISYALTGGRVFLLTIVVYSFNFPWM